jgi:ABC-type transport system substrate-binding protein
VVLYQGLPCIFDAALVGTDYNPEKAMRLLAEAGFTETGGNASH